MPVFFSTHFSSCHGQTVPQRYRLVYIQKGAVKIQKGTESQFCPAPSLLLLSDQDCVTAEISANSQITELLFQPEVISFDFDFETQTSRNRDQFYLDLFDIPSALHQKVLSLTPTVHQRVQDLLRSFQVQLNRTDDPFWPCQSRSFLMELLFLLRRIQINSHSGDHPVMELRIQDSLISRIILYLYANYSSKISISGLCSEFSTNRTTLSRLFKKETGSTIISFLKQIRMEISFKILHDTACPVQEISQRVGYKDLTHFSRDFKEIYQRTPSEVREEK